MTTYINVSKTLVALLALATLAFIPSGFVYGATDYFLKIDGVEGESTKGTTGETATARVTASTTEQKAQFDALLKIEGVDGESKKPGVEPDEIDVKATDEEAKKGNVEFEWKVEEGEKGDTEDLARDIKSGATTSATSTAPKGGISVAAGDINGLTAEEKEQFLQIVKAHAEVRSGQDLENFAKGILLRDGDVRGVYENEDGVGIKYKARGKFLWFIPVTFTEEVSVMSSNDEKGRVKVRFPWFSFLIKADIKASEIEEEVKKDEGHKKWIEIESWTFEEKAEAFSTLSNILKTKHDIAKNSINNVR